MPGAEGNQRGGERKQRTLPGEYRDEAEDAALAEHRKGREQHERCKNQHGLVVEGQKIECLHQPTSRMT